MEAERPVWWLCEHRRSPTLKRKGMAMLRPHALSQVKLKGHLTEAGRFKTWPRLVSRCWHSQQTGNSFCHVWAWGPDWLFGTSIPPRRSPVESLTQLSETHLYNAPKVSGSSELTPSLQITPSATKNVSEYVKMWELSDPLIQGLALELH